jgi:hypothetical protein
MAGSDERGHQHEQEHGDGHQHEDQHDAPMAKRGATRPMMGSHGGGGHEMTPEMRRHMLHQHHQRTLWCWWLLILLGFWTMLAPATFGYGSDLAQPSGGREVWLSLEARITAMTWSDVISGVLLVIFGWRTLTPNRPISQWICCLVGVWLSAAPLLLWAPSAAAYLNDTLVGALVIALTVLIPGMPNMIMYMQMGPQTPPGWTYNPSSWPQRWIMIATGFAGWLVSRYLGAFQLGYIDQVWDPFFGSSSRKVLDSKLSHSWPISDAGLGAFSYTFEALMGFMGSPARWRTMPWMVTIFGILVIPLGLVHIALVISQPVVVGEWCTLCLLAAAIMLPMIPLEVDEVVAMCQYLKQARNRGQSLWHAFWKGGSVDGGMHETPGPELHELPQQPAAVLKASAWGLSVPWNLVATLPIGIWLLFAPWVFGSSQPASAVDHLGGAIAITIAVISWGEVVRSLRWLNLLLGLGIAILPWFLAGAGTAATVNDTLSGLAIAALALRRGPIKWQYGSWDRMIR